MKTKHLLYVVVTSLLVMSSIASFSQGFGLGARFGFTASKWSNWSKLLTDEIVDASVLNPSLIGLQGSLVLNPMFSKVIGLEIEINFEQKGDQLKWSEKDKNGKSIEKKATATYNYVTLPILLKGGYSFGVFKIYALVGPYVGYAINAKGKYYENNTVKEQYNIEFGRGAVSGKNGTAGGPRSLLIGKLAGGSNYTWYKSNSLDAGLTLGLQPAVHLGPGDLVLDFRYNWGFIGLDNPTSGQKSDYNKTASDNDKLSFYPLCNRSLGFSIGYIFILGK